MASFVPKRSLLNPKFEGYKLELMSQENAVTRFPLPYKSTQATTSGKIPLSFQEMQSRITHNHISIENETSQACYVDSEYRVILIELGGEVPSFRIVHELPTPVQSSSTAIHREYPSAMFIGPTLVVASDGNGSLYVFSVKDRGLSESIGIYSLMVDSVNMPFKLHQVHRVSATAAFAVLSSKSHTDKEHPTKDKHKATNFDVWAIKIDLLSLRPTNTPREMDILWHRQGPDVPISVSYLEQFSSHILIGGAAYHDPSITFPLPYEPSPDEIASIPRSNESLYKSEETPKPPPYSWTQTHDSITIAIPLPSNTTKNSIHVSFAPTSLTVHVDYITSTSLPTPRYSAKALWDGISPSSSFWTWDREGEHTCGLLTLHLDKQHEKTRWMQVFASAGIPSGDGAASDDVEVPETLDPSELWLIRESLEKYTESLRDGNDASDLGLGTEVPSLADGEMDEEVDGSVGRQANVTWVARDGSTPPLYKLNEQAPIQLLAAVLPGLPDPDLSLVIKNNLDGLVFSVKPDSSKDNQPSWVHTSTFSAIAFVLASKRDTRFTYLIPTKAVLAFEGGGRNRSGNLYIYYGAPTKDLWAKQSLLKIDDSQGGALLGVGAMYGKHKQLLVVCLTERELVLIQGL